MFETTNIYSFDLKKIDVNAKEFQFYKLDKPQMPIYVN